MFQEKQVRHLQIKFYFKLLFTERQFCHATASRNQTAGIIEMSMSFFFHFMERLAVFL